MSDRKPIDVAVIVNDPISIDACKKFFSPTDVARRASDPSVTFHSFSSLAAFDRATKEKNKFSGVFIDTKLVTQATSQERRFFEEFVERKMPTLNIHMGSVNSDPVARQLMMTKWSRFLVECREFAPRGQRRFARKLCFLKLKLSDPAGQQSELKSVTSDLSPGGCFVVSFEDWSSVKEVRLQLGDCPQCVRARVAWHIPYGESQWHLPGFGLEFVERNADFEKEVARYLAPSRR